MFKPGFFGKNPPKWWIGQVPLGQTDNKTEALKWGDRVKVRIMGYHPKEGNLLSDEDLPWAIILKPSSQGNLNRGSTSIIGGEWVIGIFLDDDCERPMILGIMGRSNPGYEVTLQDQQSQQSTEFKQALPYFDSIGAQPYQLISGPGASDTPFVPDQSQFPSSN